METGRLDRAKMAKMALMTTGLTMSVILGQSFFNQPQASDSTKKPAILNCVDSNGRVVSYGAVCVSGTSGCESNSCP